MKKNKAPKMKIQKETLSSLSDNKALDIHGGIDVGTFGCLRGGDIRPALSGGWPCCLDNS